MAEWLWLNMPGKVVALVVIAALAVKLATLTSSLLGHGVAAKATGLNLQAQQLHPVLEARYREKAVQPFGVDRAVATELCAQPQQAPGRKAQQQDAAFGHEHTVRLTQAGVWVGVEVQRVWHYQQV